MIPKAVVIARDSDDVAKVIAYGRRHSIPVVFRAGGTSLNGQAQTDGILVDVRRHLRGVEVEDGGARARVEPGTLLGHVNRVLAPHGRKLGPDPASTDIACVGGVIANNSGGMRCGVTRDSYETVRELTFVLASGTVIDTGAADAERRFAEAEPELAAGLAEIRDEIVADAELASGSGASSRSRTRPATGSARSSTPRRRWRSSGGCWSAPRARSASSPRPSSRPCRAAPHDPLVASLRRRRRGARAGRRVRRRGSAGGRADGRARADRRGHNIRGTPEYWKELARSRPRCWSSSAARTRTSWRRRRPRPRRCSRAAS